MQLNAAYADMSSEQDKTNPFCTAGQMASSAKYGKNHFFAVA
jgi:hypothetical protein